jgi:hypothetical protein
MFKPLNEVAMPARLSVREATFILETTRERRSYFTIIDIGLKMVCMLG